MTKLEEFEQKFKKLTEEYPDCDAVTIVVDNNGNLFIGGNSCLVCAVEILAMFIIKNKIRHDNESNENENLYKM